MMKLKIFTIAAIFVSLVGLGSGCSKNDEKLAYLKEKERLLEAELAAKQVPQAVAQPAAAPVVAASPISTGPAASVAQ